MEKRPKTPLSVRAADFRTGGRHVRMDALYGYWFEFLRLSPSYQLARRVRSGEPLSAKDKERLPADFARVLEVYDDFGDVQRALFRPWWLRRGLTLMGRTGEPPSVQQLGVLSATSTQVSELLQKNMSDYVESAWTKQSKPDALVLAIPLTAQRTKIMRSIRKLLNEHPSPQVGAPEPKYALLKKKTHVSSLKFALKALWHRALDPKRSLWRIGAEIRISPTFSEEVDPKASHRTKDTTYARKMLAILTSRTVSRGLMLAENAARGVFPSYAKCPHAVKFDAKEFHEVLKASAAWQKTEKARILAKAK